MAVAGVVVLYHPDEQVMQNIQSYLPYIDKLYVADNTESSMSVVASLLADNDKVQVFWNGNNEGIARRLNEAAKNAIEENFNWLLTMDQDSRFEDTGMQDYLLCSGSFLYKDRTAMFGVNHISQTDSSECSSQEVMHLITSGSIINLQLFDAVGEFDENLFIDEVDLEYCYRAITKGYKIIQFSNVFLIHSLGKVSQHKSLKNLATTPRTLHAPVRLYYMVRNYLYVAKKYPGRFAESDAYRRTALLNRVKNNLLYGKERIKTVKYILQAYHDYRKGKLGKSSLH